MMQKETQNSDEIRFKNPIRVSEWLRRQGYKASQRKIYADVAKGLLVPLSGGEFTMAAVEHYIKLANLKQPAATGVTTSKMAEALKMEELKIAKLKREKLEREAARETRGWIRRGDFNREMAARAAVLDQGVQNFFRLRVPDLVSMCGGDAMKVSTLVDYALAEWNVLLAEYVDVKQFTVVFEAVDQQ